jgi:two-component system nitrogen regulation response regulator NtrX
MYPQDQEILVVADDAKHRERIAGILLDEGFTVTQATGGLAALRAVAARRFALMVADARLPGSLDGRTTVRRARARQPWLKALLIEDHYRDPRSSTAGVPDGEELIFAPFERHELIGCTFELLHRSAAADDLARRARTAFGSFPAEPRYAASSSS